MDLLRNIIASGFEVIAHEAGRNACCIILCRNEGGADAQNNEYTKESEHSFLVVELDKVNERKGPFFQNEGGCWWWKEAGETGKLSPAVC